MEHLITELTKAECADILYESFAFGYMQNQLWKHKICSRVTAEKQNTDRVWNWWSYLVRNPFAIMRLQW